MDIIIKGDYFQSKFHSVKNDNAQFNKLCPADLSRTLWTASEDLSHIDHVIESAQKGFQTWRKTSLEERIKVLKRYQEIVAAKADEIALAIALDTGKPLWESKTEAAALAGKVNVTISDSLPRIADKKIENIMPGIDGHELRRALGVCFIIGPFNFPCHLANGQLMSALITGNSIIFKPSEKTVYSSQLMFECLALAGFPDGVVNMINGGGKLASQICADPRVKAVYFTGSRDVGLKILDVTYRDLNKLVALELGGKNATIIHKDADLEHAMPELLRACFLSSGQRCTSTSTVLIHQNIAQEFIENFADITKKIIVDHPVDFKTEPFMGPIIDEMAVKAYEQYCAQAKAEGAQALVDLTRPDTGFEGHYVSPTIHYFDKMDKNLKTLQTEIFAPNVVFAPYTDIDEAIDMSNISEYGLAGAIFTADKNIYHKCLQDMDAGILNLNRSTVGASARLPFGGLKNSGNHHHAGVSMIEHCVETIASLETMQTGSSMDEVKGLRD